MKFNFQKVRFGRIVLFSLIAIIGTMIVYAISEQHLVHQSVWTGYVAGLVYRLEQPHVIAGFSGDSLLFKNCWSFPSIVKWSSPRSDELIQVRAVLLNGKFVSTDRTVYCLIRNGSTQSQRYSTWTCYPMSWKTDMRDVYINANCLSNLSVIESIGPGQVLIKQIPIKTKKLPVTFRLGLDFTTPTNLQVQNGPSPIYWSNTVTIQ